MNYMKKARELGYEVQRLPNGPGRYLYRIAPLGWFRTGGPTGPKFWANSQREVSELLDAIESGRPTDRWLV